MSFTFRPAKREAIPLLLGVAGGTGSGKTMSALRLARGLADGKPFAFIDTENGRGLHYADLFPEMQHGSLTAPFRPSKYADAIEAADKQGFPVIVVDSTSHEWAGEGGCCDWHDDLMGNDQSKNFSAWGPPKKDHKRMVTRLLQVNAHVILCFRAEPKIEVIDDPDKPGKKKYVEKRSLTGLEGWIPISEKMLPYELTASFLLMADAPGTPRPIKLQEQHKAFVPLTEPLTEETGRKLALWAAGSAGTPTAVDGVAAPPVSQAPTDGAKPAVVPADQMPSDAPPSSPASEGTPNTDVFITKKQRDMLWAKSTKFGADWATREAALRPIIREHTGQESSAAITRDVFEAILKAIEAAAVAA